MNIEPSVLGTSVNGWRGIPRIVQSIDPIVEYDSLGTSRPIQVAIPYVYKDPHKKEKGDEGKPSIWERDRAVGKGCWRRQSKNQQVVEQQ